MLPLTSSTRLLRNNAGLSAYTFVQVDVWPFVTPEVAPMRSATRCKNALLVLAVILTCVLAVPSMALAADSVDASGKEASVSETADATKPIWGFSGVELSASSVTSGEPVTVTPQVTGDLDGAEYNYVWQRNGSWAQGEWGSTVRDTGKGTSEATGTLTLTRPGTYTVYVDVTDRSEIGRASCRERVLRLV